MSKAKEELNKLTVKISSKINDLSFERLFLMQLLLVIGKFFGWVTLDWVQIFYVVIFIAIFVLTILVHSITQLIWLEISFFLKRKILRPNYEKMFKKLVMKKETIQAEWGFKEEE